MTRLGWVVFLVVAVSTGVAFWLEINYQLGAATSVLILGLTALLIVWYADATKQLAASTQALAESSARPDLVILCPPYPASDRELQLQWAGGAKAGQRETASRVINTGSGPAFNVLLTADSRERVTIARVLPNGGLAYDDALVDAEQSGETVALSYTDGAGNSYDFWWVYEKSIKNWRVAKPSEIAEWAKRRATSSSMHGRTQGSP